MYKLARQLDYDRTLAASYAKAPDALYALLAFQGELGAIRAKVSDPLTFEMRLIWWREALEGLSKDQLRKHPIILALAPHIKYGELDLDLLIVMVETRFREFFEPAKDFPDFIEQRRSFLQPFYMNTYLAFREDDTPENFAAFLAFDIIGCLQNLDFYRQKEIIPFREKIESAALENLLKIGPKTLSPYFRGLRALALWHHKRLLKIEFKPANIKFPTQHPGKIFALWRSKGD